jgi:hypothetical protein
MRPEHDAKKAPVFKVLNATAVWKLDLISGGIAKVNPYPAELLDFFSDLNYASSGSHPVIHLRQRARLAAQDL